MKPEVPVDSRRRLGRLCLPVFVTTCAVFVCASWTPAAAQTQTVTPPPQQLSFSRPESWVLAHFGSATLLSGLEPPTPSTAGDVSIGLELGWLPHLTATEERVGFNGTDPMDLNQAPFMPRPRVSIGLPARFTLIVAATPPIPMFGLKAALLAAGLERPIIERPSWTFGLRGYGQLGHVRGAYTCPPSVVAFPEGSPNNIMGCDRPSADTASLRYVGGEASVAYRSEASSRFSPHASIGISYMDVEFQVDALTYGFVDHTHYLSHGLTVSGSGGVSWQLSPRFTFGMDVFYSPLSVRRGPGAPIQTDGLFNVRALVTYRIR